MPTSSSRAPRRWSLEGRARLLVGLGLGLLVGGLLAVARGTRALQALEGPFLDLRTRWAAGARPPDPRIVLAQVQEDDVRAVRSGMGTRWPWPLTTNQAIVGLLGAAGARALLVDVFHADAGAGPDDLVLAEGVPPLAYRALEEEADLAGGYAQALRALPASVGVVILTPAPQYDVPARRAAGGPLIEDQGLEAPPDAPTFAAIEYPVSAVAAGFHRLGFANADVDADGVLRRAVLVMRAGGRVVPSAPLALARLLTDGPVELGAGELRLGGRRRPLDPDGSFLPDFRSKQVHAYPRVAPARLLDWALTHGQTGEVPAAAREALEGRIVIFGVNLLASDDVLPTAIDRSFDGPEWLAVVLDNLLNGGGRLRASAGLNLAMLLGVAGLTGLLGLSFRRRALPHLSAAAVAGAVVVAGFQLFRSTVALDLVTPVLAVGLTWGLVTALKLMTEGRYNRWLEGTFSRYLAPSVIDALKQDPRLLDLGGSTREITVLFSDVAGFTGLSEALTPAQVVELLNRYLTTHCEAVFAEGGVVDKFIGDAVMAFYGDPIPQEDHALRACRTALAVQAALPALEPVWRGMGLREFKVRIGLNSGRAVVGNMGSTQRFDYTAMGDTVNLASRLEGANKAFGTRILLGPETRALAGEAVLARPLTRLTVVGRAEPAPVYELVALRAGAPETLVRHVEAFERAQEAARRADWAAARDALEEAERLRPGDGPTAWFRSVLEDQAATGTPWSGVLGLTSK